MAELRSIEFLTFGRISIRHACPFVTSISDRRRANDFQWRSPCAPIAPGELHSTGLKMADSQSSPVDYKLFPSEYEVINNDIQFK
jgi:hypothetical protein